MAEWHDQRLKLGLGSFVFFLLSQVFAEPQLGIQGKTNDSLGDPTSITVEDVLNQGLQDHPRLKAFELKVKAAEARESQEKAFPNPEVGVDLENLLGNGDFAGFKRLETTARIGQPIPIGGRRGRQTEVAAEKRRLAELEYQAVREALRIRIRRAFVEGLLAQSLLALNEEVVRLYDAFLKSTITRRKAGRDSPLEEEKARVLLAQAILDRDRALREMEAAFRNLAVAMGKRKLPADALKGNLEDSLAFASMDTYGRNWSAHPASQALAQEGRIRSAELSLRKAERIPDLRLSAGIRQSNEADAYAMVLGVSTTLPLWNRNSAGIREAELLLAKSKADSIADALHWEARIGELFAAMSGAFEEARRLNENIIQPGERIQAAALEGYSVGRLIYRDVIEAQKNLFEAKSRYFWNLAQFHRQRIALESGSDIVFENSDFPIRK